MKKTLPLLISSIIMCSAQAETVRFATFNVSMDGSNYTHRDAVSQLTQSPLPQVLQENHPQIRAIAEILQRVRPDVVLLNEFDYVEAAKGVHLFQEKYLSVSQNEQQPIEYPYVYFAPVNTGRPSPFDLNRDGKADGKGNDAWGFGWYEGQYGMMLLSRYPIVETDIRTFQHFRWQDMPNHQIVYLPDNKEEKWYSDEVMAQFPLSSKSHWDIPIKIGAQTIHVLAAHPTPPAFDGKEKRNVRRNHDEIRLFADYISPEKSDYLYDDKGEKGGIAPDAHFVILGDYNADPNGGNAEGAIEQLLQHRRVQDPKPTSNGGEKHTPDNPLAKYHTADWRMRVDYVLPSDSLKIKGSGIFWPTDGDAGVELVKQRSASSDHRLVWLDIEKPD